MQIEELKAKYDATEADLADCRDENNSQRTLIEEQHRTIQLLEEKLAESERRRTQADTGLARSLEAEREKQRHRVGELSAELEELRRECKAKDLQLFEIEDEVEVLRSQLREQYLQEKKKTVAEWEERLRNALADRAVREQEND
jgi:chromosome segregation ATPase